MEFEGDSTNCTIINNLIHDNSVGLELKEGCERFQIYNNSFWYNNQANAIDNGNSNFWDDGVSLGNQWDDYNGTGLYSIAGSAGSVDHFPRVDSQHTRTTTTAITTTTTTYTTSDGTITIDQNLLIILGIGGVGVVVFAIAIFIRKH